MKDNVLISENGLEVYQSEIDVLCDEYIESLPDPSMIHKTATFAGLLNYLYKNKIKHIIDTDKTNNYINQYNNNYVLLDGIFNIYVDICSKYGFTPTILQFTAEFVKINNANISDIRQGKYRNKGVKVNPLTTQIIKGWYDTCEARLSSRTIEDNSIGSMFTLKAKYGWTEQPQEILLTTNQQTASPEQIAERYKAAEKPELIEELAD